MGDRIKTKNGEVWVEGEILMMKMSGEIEEDEMKEIARINMDMIKKFKLKYVLVVSDVTKTSFDARQMASNFNLDPIKKIAMICKNPVTRIIASFFMRKYALTIPTKLFSDTEEAKKWLREGK